MHVRCSTLARTGVAALSLVAIALGPTSAAAQNLPAEASPVAEQHVPVCPGPARPGNARCHAQIRTDAVARSARPTPSSPQAPNASASATLGNGGAYDPAYLESAYNAPSWSAGAGQTVAIVDAYDDPTAESDMNNYRAFFGLPACTTANGCFRKLNQSGAAGSYPAASSSWSQEISLDLDMVSAICPECNIMLVEAQSTSISNLGTAVNTAARLGANAISNSYGGTEFSGETTAESTYYNHPGIAITVSSGDNGYGVEYPAASRYVTAVGGTTLHQNSNTGTRNATESAWSGAGSGCSAYVPKPTWQSDAGCARRSVADTSAVADPATGVWVYYRGGWYIIGGTSAASPIIASMYALAGNASTVTSGASSGAQYSYAHTTSLNDITSGSNGSCSPSYLCKAGAGYDGPTGNGTPNATGAF